MTFEEFLEEKNLTPENTPGSEHALIEDAYNAGYESAKNTLLKEARQLQKENVELIKETVELIKKNKQLKKNSLVWHKINFEKSTEFEEGKKYLLLSKYDDILVARFWRSDTSCCFGHLDWKEIEAWAERPEVEL